MSEITNNLMYYYRLEYSEKQGFFHYAQDNLPVNTSYRTICNNISYNQCNEFTQNIFKKYPNVNTGEGDAPPFHVIYDEFRQFLYS
jgi:hypothetical protein